MADPSSYASTERNTEPALLPLKKGTQLIKYSRKGKPKFCTFRLSTDETTLLWYSRGRERNLKLSSVQKITLGQRTAVFRRYLRPEKDYLSFSLIYNNSERSLDLICKDQEETEVWLTGLKLIISRGEQSRRSKNDLFDFTDGPDILSSRPSLEKSFGRLSADSFPSPDVGPEQATMQIRGSPGDGFRLSVSSTPSCSSTGSGQDDIESLGDVYVWGELWSDGNLPDGSVSAPSLSIDVLIPKPLETNVVLDAQQIACGARHVALVNRQGEIFTWGEEYGGRLGHGIEKDFNQPHLVEFLAVTNVELVECGEHHTCAISTSGDLFTWGDGIHNSGVLGHGTYASHWIPKRVSGPLEGLQVQSVACGTWHSAIIISTGKIFTFGQGKFGVLGHGDEENVSSPKEVQQLTGFKIIKVACGVWHTAAIVEVRSQNGPSSYRTSRKLFTWGDGDKYRLGHGNKDTYFLPTCVSALIDYSFHQIACGHNTTIALATSGHIFTMGSNAYGQLGNQYADERKPCLVQDKLVGEFVEEIACGAYHVAVLTSRGEVFTWGKGANGRLGHGDVEDRRSPTLVEALKDRHVRSIACGSNFTASICIHKWVSGADQSVCYGCRQAFGFTRKRHNCYNCGLVHCHGCSSKKALRAALAPTPGKPHRVCDACYNKLKATGVGNGPNFIKKSAARISGDNYKDKFDKDESRSARILPYLTLEPVKYLEVRSHKAGAKSDSVTIVRASQVPSIRQMEDISFPSSLSAMSNAPKPVAVGPPNLTVPASSSSRPASPFYRRASPPRASTPVFSRGIIDNLKKSNGVLSQEVTKLQNQIKSLSWKNQEQEEEIRNLQQNSKEATKVAVQQSSKCRLAREVVGSLTAQLKEAIEKLPPEASASEILKAMQIQAETYLEASKTETDNSLPSLQEEAQPSEQAAEISGVRDIPQNTESTAEDDGEEKPAQTSTSENKRAKEVIEQFEPGVFVTVIQLPDGSKDFQRVRFSKRKFSEQQAGEWWRVNKDRVMKRYARSTPATSSYDT